MLLTGDATMVGFRNGTKNEREWCTVVLDAIDDPMERVEYFVPDALIGKVKVLKSGPVRVKVRVYPLQERGFGSRLVDIDKK